MWYSSLESFCMRQAKNKNRQYAKEDSEVGDNVKEFNIKE